MASYEKYMQKNMGSANTCANAFSSQEHSKKHSFTNQQKILLERAHFEIWLGMVPFFLFFNFCYCQHFDLQKKKKTKKVNSKYVVLSQPETLFIFF